MSYTLKVILISLGVWLGASLLIGGITMVKEGDFLNGFLIAGLFIGLMIAAATFITSLVILLAKLDGKKRDQPSNDDVLDGQLQKLRYQERALAFMAATGVILLVGSSVCFGMFSV